MQVFNTDNASFLIKRLFFSIILICFICVNYVNGQDLNCNYGKPSIKHAQEQYSILNFDCVIQETSELLNTDVLGIDDEINIRLMLASAYFLYEKNEARKYQLVSFQFDSLLERNLQVELPIKPFDSAYRAYFYYLKQSKIDKHNEEGKFVFNFGLIFGNPTGDYEDYNNNGFGFHLSSFVRYKKMRFGPTLELITHKRDIRYVYNGDLVDDQTKTRDLNLVLNGQAFIFKPVFDSLVFPFVQFGFGLTFTKFSFNLDYVDIVQEFVASKSVTKFNYRFALGSDIRINRNFAAQISLGRFTKTDSVEDSGSVLPRFDDKAESYYLITFLLQFKP